MNIPIHSPLNLQHQQLDHRQQPITSESNDPSFSPLDFPSSYYLYYSLVDSLFASIASAGRLSAPHLESLQFLFPNELIRALALYEDGAITLVRARSSNRFAFRCRLAKEESCPAHGLAINDTRNTNEPTQLVDQQPISISIAATPTLPSTPSFPLSSAAPSDSPNFSRAAPSSIVCSFYSCSCSHFSRFVLTRQSLYCPHQVAARLVYAISDEAATVVSEEQFEQQFTNAMDQTNHSMHSTLAHAHAQAHSQPQPQPNEEKQKTQYNKSTQQSNLVAYSPLATNYIHR